MYTLNDYYKLENEKLKLRIAIINGDTTEATRRKLEEIEEKIENIAEELSWTIEKEETNYEKNKIIRKKS